MDNRELHICIRGQRKMGIRDSIQRGRKKKEKENKRIQKKKKVVKSSQKYKKELKSIQNFGLMVTSISEVIKQQSAFAQEVSLNVNEKETMSNKNMQGAKKLGNLLASCQTSL